MENLALLVTLSGYDTVDESAAPRMVELNLLACWTLYLLAKIREAIASQTERYLGRSFCCALQSLRFRTRCNRGCYMSAFGVHDGCPVSEHGGVHLIA